MEKRQGHEEDVGIRLKDSALSMTIPDNHSNSAVQGVFDATLV
jgi:hypothetical protein